MPSEFERLQVEGRKADEFAEQADSVESLARDMWLAGPVAPQPAYPRLLAAVHEMPWAILPGKLATIMDLLRFRAEGGRLTAEEIQQRIGAAREPVRSSGGGVAVIPVFGVISQRMSMMSEMSGGTSTERIAGAIRQALSDPAVGSIVLQIDSPGGGVYGVAELADAIYKARGQKPIVAVADSMAASAAYWIAASADEIVVTPSGEVGSIGVFAAHEDVSQMLEGAGVKINLISAGKYKTEGSPYEPLGEEARAAMQSRVNDYYTLFTKAVARGRGVSLDAVRSGFGEGRVVGAQAAVKAGMADRVDTIDATIQRLAGGRSARNGQRAVGDGSGYLAGPSIAPITAGPFAKGDRVRIVDPHEPMHKTGTIAAISPDTAYAVEIDGMEDMGPHKWYTDSEMEPMDEARSSSADLDLRRRRLRLRSH